jgi:glutamate 5-kinase
MCLLENNYIPIINENDTVATDEIHLETTISCSINCQILLRIQWVCKQTLKRNLY